jgi:hypothetical protein
MDNRMNDAINAALIGIGMKTASAAIREAKGALGDAWLAEFRERMQADIKQTEIEQATFEEEAMLYDAMLKHSAMIFLHATQET